MLEEIFKTKPSLLEEPEVQKLIEYVQGQHKRTVNIANRYQKFYDFVLDKCVHSELILINGDDSKKVLTEILLKIENE